jgi:hypothetical protein
MEINEINLFLPSHVTKMGQCLPIELINQIKLYLNLNEYIPDIAAALKVLKVTIYKLQLNWDLWDQLYAPLSVKLGRLSTLLEYQKLVSSLSMVLRHYWRSYCIRDYLSSLVKGPLLILIRCKTSSLINLISKLLLIPFTVFLRLSSSLKRQS